MAKILVFQHVPYEPLGTLDPLIRARRHRIRYVNFHRTPRAIPDIDGYDALIVLGGPMNLDQEATYPHLQTEKAIIRQAAKRNIPILGICLGAQLIAAAFGARIYPAQQNEIGWTSLTPTSSGETDPLIKAFQQAEKVFQWHGYTFDLPQQAELLVSGQQVAHQAYRIGKNIYGFQFHLEANLPLIKRWLKLPHHQAELGKDNVAQRADAILEESERIISRSNALSLQVFSKFLELVPKVKSQHRFEHRVFSTIQSPVTSNL